MEDNDKLTQSATTQLEQDKIEISAMMDGELSLEEIKVLIEKIKFNPTLRAYWRSQHQIAVILKDSHMLDWLSIDKMLDIQCPLKSAAVIKSAMQAYKRQ